MFRRNWILALVSLIIAIILFFMASGCSLFMRLPTVPSSIVPEDDEDALIAIPEFGFMFDANHWWTIKRSRRTNEISPVILYNQVYAAQVLLTVWSSIGEDLSQMAWDERQRELVHHEDVSMIVSDRNETVQWLIFSYHVGPQEKPLQEFFLFAKAKTLPEYAFVFYGTWEGEHEDNLKDQVIEMASTLRVMPPQMIELQ